MVREEQVAQPLAHWRPGLRVIHAA
jgi:hypothetical protein